MGSIDRIVERLTYFDQEEHYEMVSINGRPAPGVEHLQLTGATSVGEFGSALREIFSPATGTEFKWVRIMSIRGRRVYVFKFKVPKETGIEIRDVERNADVTVGYDGFVFIDAQIGTVLRVTSSLHLPPGLSIKTADRSVEYAPVTIADKTYTLPVHSEVIMQNENTRYVNEIEFTNYHKFGTESILHYDEPGTR